jgi:hypothetical protein
MAYKFTTSDYTIGICKVIVLQVIRVFTTSDYPIGICKVMFLQVIRVFTTSDYHMTMTLQIPMG